MYISRIKLNISNSKAMQAISSPQVVHALVEGCFVQKNRTLWRMDSLGGNLYLLIVSKEEPNFDDLATQLCERGEIGHTKNYASFLTKIENGQRLRFRFRGNTVHSVVKNKGERGKVKPYFSEKNKREWVLKKAEKNGFVLEENDFAMVDTGQQRFNKRASRNHVELSYATFEGVLTVADSEKFVTALTQGIGRGKAYGCGMMTVIM
ncbi:MAG: type I-E CRISPR-associated protein Cas6/Cse3/CasE [Oscillospiraceae bacterium]|nr:type I-E CRISPR-associated protein Cas6/Cse3/CasE [Oscillospiraceae bacterium]